MLKIAGTLFLGLFLLLAGYAVVRHYQREADKQFRESVVAELPKLDSARREASGGPATATIGLASELMKLRSHITDHKLKELLLGLIKGCEMEVRWRTGLESLEKKVREHYDGVLPPWLTQDRHWQGMNEELKRRRFGITPGHCNEVNERVSSYLKGLELPRFQRQEDPRNKTVTTKQRAEREEAQPAESLPGSVREELIQSALERVRERAQSGQKKQKGEGITSGPAEGEGAAAIGAGGRGGGVVKPAEFLIYYNQMLRLIRARWTWEGKRTDLEATVRFGIQENGQILDLKVVRSSGDSSYDDSIITAVKRASPMPPPPESYRKDFMDVELTFRPKDLGR